MAATTFATPGYPVLTPTKVKGSRTGTANGTYIEGIDEREISFDPGLDLRVRRVGLGADSGFRVRHGRTQPAKLYLPLRNQGANGLKLILAQLTTDGAIFRPTGGTAAAPYSAMPTFALIIRPDSTSEKYLYSPNWALAPETLQLIRHSEIGAQASLTQLVLVATRPTSATSGVPAYEWAASATIATAFSLTEGP